MAWMAPVVCAHPPRHGLSLPLGAARRMAAAMRRRVWRGGGWGSWGGGVVVRVLHIHLGLLASC